MIAVNILQQRLEEIKSMIEADVRELARLELVRNSIADGERLIAELEAAIHKLQDGLAR
jgi:hypothetical protein